jgi:HPt (histidine-containing phosphotransfer) domain-containing protein
MADIISALVTPPNAMSTSALLDLSRAKEFAVETEQLRELVVTFEQSLTQEMTLIQAALAVGDALKVEHSLHALKGFMPLFSVASLAQAMTDLYQTSRDKPLDVTGPLFTALVPSLEALLVEVRACLSAL